VARWQAWARAALAARARQPAPLLASAGSVPGAVFEHHHGWRVLQNHSGRSFEQPAGRATLKRNGKRANRPGITRRIGWAYSHALARECGCKAWLFEARGTSTDGPGRWMYWLLAVLRDRGPSAPEAG